MIRRLIATALVCGLWAAAAPAQDATYAIKFRQAAAGDRIRVTVSDESESGVALAGVDPQDVPKRKASIELVYTEETVARPAGAKRPTKLVRTYATAEETHDGLSKTLPYLGKAVTIETGDKAFTFTADGAVLGDADAKAVAADLDRAADDPWRPTNLVPAKPVRVDDEWALDAAKLTAAYGADGKITFDRAKTTATGRLTKAYRKASVQYGVIEVKVKLAPTELAGLKVGDNPAPLKADSRITVALTLDVCIDGSARTGKTTTVTTNTYVVDIPCVDLTVASTSTRTRTVGPAGPK